MLSYSFQHLRGIGAKKEAELWNSGIFSLKDLVEKQGCQLSLFSNNAQGEEVIADSYRALLEEDVDFFAKRLARREHYRIALQFPEKVLFLDIETTGLSIYYDSITLVGWSMGRNYGVYIKGDDNTELKSVLANAKAIVTFNGSLFDLPFLRKEFPELEIPKVHVDLRFFAKRVGLSGGQKAIEKEIGAFRTKSLVEVKGESAPILWHEYRRGNLNALKLLVKYNHADIEGMKRIFDFAVQRLCEEKEIPIQCIGSQRFSSMSSKIKWANSKRENSKNGIQLRPYAGNIGPVLTISNLLSRIITSEPPRIVGIDLTGSQSKSSGWCLLEEECVSTQRVDTDEEIIRTTLAVKPHLISIDSPLSLPQGRIMVSDDDPGRKEYGITRHCERELKKRGVNVYPCLIRSMQALTERGIRLANHFRHLGIPVIESYPGAAQDIMNIPRKRAGLEHLKTGLAEFGIRGAFLEQEVSHDELDAITSSIVGLFFMGGNAEALGNEHENFLIIPKIHDPQEPHLKAQRKIIGFSGQIASGKTTAAKYLEACGFHYGRFSLVLADLLRERGITPDRQSLQRIGLEISAEQGKQRWLCQQVIQRLPSTGDLVIDGLRFPEDHATLFETFGTEFVHIHIKAPYEQRLKRYIANSGNKEEFLEASEHNVEASIARLENLANVVIINNFVDRSEFLEKIAQEVDCHKPRSRRIFACQ